MTTVRQLRADEWELFRDLRLRALRDAPEAFYETYERAAALTEADWRDRLTPADRVTFVAELDDDAAAAGPGAGRTRRAVGMIIGAPASESEADPDAALMLSTWVDPSVRGQAVADALTTALLDWSRERGYKRLLLWVYAAAPRAAAFYRRAGFEPTGRVEDFGFPTRPLTLMSQTL